MSSRKIEAIVFDLGGVLVDWNPRFLYCKIFDDPSEMESFLSQVCHQTWNEKQDAGRLFQEGIQELVQKFPHYEMQIRAYHQRWPEMIGGDIPGTVRILESLRESGQHKIFALSNWSSETFPHARTRFSFFRHFDGILLSGEEKLIKPDARFFKILTDRYGVDPATSIFIDDVEKNVEAARNLGYRAIRFTDPEALRHSLGRFGVLIDPVIEK